MDRLNNFLTPPPFNPAQNDNWDLIEQVVAEMPTQKTLPDHAGISASATPPQRKVDLYQELQELTARLPDNKSTFLLSSLDIDAAVRTLTLYSKFADEQKEFDIYKINPNRRGNHWIEWSAVDCVDEFQWIACLMKVPDVELITPLVSSIMKIVPTIVKFSKSKKHVCSRFIIRGTPAFGMTGMKVAQTVFKDAYVNIYGVTDATRPETFCSSRTLDSHLSCHSFKNIQEFRSKIRSLSPAQNIGVCLDDWSARYSVSLNGPFRVAIEKVLSSEFSISGGDCLNRIRAMDSIVQKQAVHHQLRLLPVKLNHVANINMATELCKNYDNIADFQSDDRVCDVCCRNTLIQAELRFASANYVICRECVFVFFPKHFAPEMPQPGRNYNVNDAVLYVYTEAEEISAAKKQRYAGNKLSLVLQRRWYCELDYKDRIEREINLSKLNSKISAFRLAEKLRNEGSHGEITETDDVDAMLEGLFCLVCGKPYVGTAVNIMLSPDGNAVSFTHVICPQFVTSEPTRDTMLVDSFTFSVVSSIPVPQNTPTSSSFTVALPARGASAIRKIKCDFNMQLNPLFVPTAAIGNFPHNYVVWVDASPTVASLAIWSKHICTTNLEAIESWSVAGLGNAPYDASQVSSELSQNDSSIDSANILYFHALKLSATLQPNRISLGCIVTTFGKNAPLTINGFQTSLGMTTVPVSVDVIGSITVAGGYIHVAGPVVISGGTIDADIKTPLWVSLYPNEIDGVRAVEAAAHNQEMHAGNGNQAQQAGKQFYVPQQHAPKIVPVELTPEQLAEGTARLLAIMNSRPAPLVPVEKPVEEEIVDVKEVSTKFGDALVVSGIPILLGNWRKCLNQLDAKISASGSRFPKVVWPQKEQALERKSDSQGDGGGKKQKTKEERVKDSTNAKRRMAKSKFVVSALGEFCCQSEPFDFYDICDFFVGLDSKDPIEQVIIEKLSSSNRPVDTVKSMIVTCGLMAFGPRHPTYINLSRVYGTHDPAIIEHARVLDQGYLVNIELNPGPPSDIVDVISEQIIEDFPVTEDHEADVEKWAESRLVNEQHVIDALRSVGVTGSKHDLDKHIASIAKDSSQFDSLLGYLSRVLAGNNYVGPQLMGGALSPVTSVRDVAERISIPPNSRLDDIVRRHDLLYTLTDDPALRAKSDDLIVEAISNISDQTSEEKLAMKALQLQSSLNRYKAYDRFGPKIPLSKDGDVEMNPGPRSFEKMMARLAKWAADNNVDLNNLTALGHAAVFNALIPTMEPRIHDSMFTKQQMLSMTADNVARMTDVPFDFFNVFPDTLRDRAGANIAFPPLVVTEWNPEAGLGPNCLAGPLCAAFKNLEMEAAQLLAILRVNAVMFPGSRNLLIWSLTKTLENGDSDTSPNSGSNAYILVNLMYMLHTSDANNAFFSVQKNVLFKQMKPVTVIDPVAQAGVFPRHGFPGLGIGCCTVEEYLAYTCGTGPRPEWNAVPIQQNMIFVYMTDDMLQDDVTIRRARTLYSLSHGPFPIWNPGPVVMREKDTIGGINRSQNTEATWAAYMNKTNWSIAGDAALYIIIVRIPTTPAAGNFGAAAIDFQFDWAVAGNVVSSVANNPFRGGLVPVNGVAAAPAIRAALRAGSTQTSFPLAASWWMKQYGTKTDMLTALMMYATMNSLFYTNVYANHVEGYCATSMNPLAGYPDIDPASIDNTFTVARDMFGRDRTNFGIIMSFSFMESPLRLAMVTGVRIPKGSVSSTLFSSFNSSIIGCHIRDITRLVGAIADDLLNEENMTMEQLMGRASNNQVQQDVLQGVFTVQIPHIIMKHIGLAIEGQSATIWALPALQVIPAGPYKELCEAIYPRFVTDRSFSCYDFYVNISTSNKRSFPFGEMAQPVTASVVNNAALVVVPVVKSTTKPTPEQLSKFLQWLPKYTFLGDPAQVNKFAGFMISDNSNVALRVMVPLVMMTDNVWRNAYLGDVAAFNGSLIQSNYELMSSEPATAPVFSYDTIDEVKFAWTPASDNIRAGNLMLFQVYDTQVDTTLGGLLFPVVKNQQKNMKIYSLIGGKPDSPEKD